MVDENPDAEIDRLRQKVKDESDNSLWWNALALVLNNKGDYDGAIDVCRKAIEINPKNATIWVNLGFALNH
nr:tetratricopeptide repeat protein [Candidatus Sigynarchaeota archaeon]